MEKEAVIHYLDKMVKDNKLMFEGLEADFILLYLDVSSEPDLILEIIGKNKSRFMFIIWQLLSNIKNHELYRKEGEGVYAMKFVRANSRIYCRELTIDDKKRIIMSRAKLTKKEQPESLIEALEGYEFEYFSKYEETDDYKQRHKEKQS